MKTVVHLNICVLFVGSCGRPKQCQRSKEMKEGTVNVLEWALFVIMITGGTKLDECGSSCAIAADAEGVQREIET